MDLQKLLFLAAAVVFGLACRSFDNRYLLKLGWLSYLGASYLAGFFLTGSHVAGAFGVSLWFLLPWVEIVGYVRFLRFPERSEVKHRFAPSQEVFPELEELTEDMIEEGFEKVEDTGWNWGGAEQFVRLFEHEERRAQAAITQVRFEKIDIVFSYVSVTSRALDGRIFTTTNYPFAPAMRFVPGQIVNREVHLDTLGEMMSSHEDFLDAHGLGQEDLEEADPENLASVIERDLGAQIEHNLKIGVLEPAGENGVRYSWRGCFYLWFEAVKDMVRV